MPEVAGVKRSYKTDWKAFARQIQASVCIQDFRNLSVLCFLVKFCFEKSEKEKTGRYKTIQVQLEQRVKVCSYDFFMEWIGHEDRCLVYSIGR